MKKHFDNKQNSRFIMEELEPRQLFSGGIEGLLISELESPIATYIDIDGSDEQISTQQDQTPKSSAAEKQSYEIIFVDTGVDNYQALVDDLLNNTDNNRIFEVVLLDTHQNGIEQISDTLLNHDDLDAIHIISHGEDGNVQLGNTRLNAETLTENNLAIALWTESFTETGDILIYGCNLAETEIGQNLVEGLSQLTQADVAASDDLTGHSTLGGDWELEYKSGSIETDLAVSTNSQQDWSGVFATTPPIAHWTFDTDAIDSSGNNYDGALTDDAAIDTTTASNLVGGGKLSLDGTDGHVDLSLLPHISNISNLTEGSISAWFNTTDADFNPIFSVTDSNNPHDYAYLEMQSGRLLFEVVSGGVTQYTVQHSTLLNDGNWHHVSITADSGGNHFYVDGVEILAGGGITYWTGGSGNTEFFDDVNNVDTIKIGALTTSTSSTVRFTGFLDDVQIHDYALTSEQVAIIATVDDAPTFTPPPTFTAQTISTTADASNSVTTADVNGDGDMDILSASAADNKIAWYENDGSENFTAHTITTSANNATSVTTVDMDGDGDMDVLSSSYTDNKIAWYENDGNENFTARTISTAALGARSVTTADVDGDGDMDVLSASAVDDKIAWYENDGNENFTARTISTVADVAYSVTTADVDGDGDMDVLSASAGDHKIAWYENDGSENFTTHIISTVALGARSVTTADVDGDGDIDVLSASTADDKITWYENDGSENFTAHTITSSADSTISVNTADMDGDGDIDVLSASVDDDKITWYENDGNESFTAHTITVSADGASSVATADIDGDGDMDVLSSSFYDDKIAWYQNQGSSDLLDGSPTFIEGGVAVVLDSDVDVSDSNLDSFNGGFGDYSGASLTLVRNTGATAEDVFDYNDGNGITLVGGNLIKNGAAIASFDTTTPGQLVITFTNVNGEIPTSSDVDNILHQIIYANSSDAPPASAQIDWTFNDGNSGAQGAGGALEATGSTTVSITAINDTPTATGGNVTGLEDINYLFRWSDFNISDVDTPITLQTAVRIDSLPVNGTLQHLNGSAWVSVSTGQLLTKLAMDTGSVRFVPLAGEAGHDGYSNSGLGDGFDDYAQFNYTPIHSTPITILNPDSETNLLAEGGSTSPASGWVSSGGGSFNPTTVSYATDHDNVFYANAAGTLTQTLGTTFSSSNDYSLSVEFGWRNEIATSPNFRAELRAGATLLGFIDQTNVTLVKGELVGGTLSVNGSSFVALDGQSLQVRLIGGNYDNVVLTEFDRVDDVADAASVMNIDITPINSVPVAIANTVTTNEDTAYTFVSNDFTFTDVDSDALLSVTINNLNLAGGTLTHSGGTTVSNGTTLSTAGIATLVYTPANNASGAPLATFDFTVNDAGAGIASAQMDINVSAVNDAPVTGNASSGIPEDPTYVQINLNGTDIDGTVTHFRLNNSPANGILYLDSGLTIAIAAGVDYAKPDFLLPMYFVPDTNWNGITTFDYIAKDDQGAYSAAAGTATINITAVNDAPTTTPVTLTAIAEDSGVRLITQVELLNNAADVDGSGLTATNLAIATGVGTLVDNLDGTWNYTAVLNDDTAVTFTYTVTDSLLTAAGTTSLDITPINDIPSSTNATILAPTNSTFIFNANHFNFSDVDSGDSLQQIRISSTAGSGSLQINGSAVLENQVVTRADIDAGLLTFIPVVGESGSNYASFNFEVHDGTAFAGITSAATINVGGLTPFFNQRIQGGGIVVDSAGMRADDSFTGGTLTPIFSIAGIPAGATVVNAYLLINELDHGSLDTTFTLDGNALTVNQVGESTSPGWGASRVVTFRADVSTLVTGNGSYTLGGAGEIGADAYEGASLVVVYEDTSVTTDSIITLHEGSVTQLDSPVTIPIEFNTNNPLPQNFLNANMTLVTFDGQDSFPDVAIDFQATSAGSATTIIPTGNFGSDQGGGEQFTIDISALITQADTGADLTQTTPPTNSDDYLVYPFIGTVIQLDNAAPTLDDTGNMSLTSITEDQTNSIGDIISDVILSAGGDRITDLDNGALEGIAITSLSSGNGSWEYSTNAGGSWNTVSVVSDASALLLSNSDFLRFVPDGQNADSANFDFRAWDHTSGIAGNKVDTSTNGGTTTFSTATETATITVTSVNDQLTTNISINQTKAYNEGSAGVGLDNIVVTDVDSGEIITATLTLNDPTFGALSTSGSASYSAATGVWTITGNVAEVNTALTNVTFNPTLNNDQNTTVSVSIVDGGENGTTAATGTITLNVIAINDAPINNVPSAQAVNEDTNLVFNSANSNLISITDVDAGSTLRVTLTPTNGLVTLTPTLGLIFTVGDGIADTNMTFEGSLADINAALDGLSFIGDQDFNGTANIQITTDDLTLITLNEDASQKGYYTFNNTGDLGNDDSVGGANDIVDGSSITTTSDATHGDVLSFDGNDDVQITGFFGSPTEVTLAGWINLDSGSSNDYVISLGDNVGIIADEGGGRGVSGFFYDGSSWRSTPSNQFIAGTGWHHVAYTFSDSGNVQALYIDGIEVGSTNFTTSPSYSLGTDSYIGRHGYDAVGYFHGKIDEARIYDRALAASEIQTLVDGQVTTDTDNIAITVNAVNDAPNLTLDPGGGTYNEADPQFSTYIDINAIITDTESGDYNGAQISTTIITNGTTNDRLLVKHEGTGAGEVNVSGNDILINGNVVATISGGIGDNDPLIITFNNNSTVAIAQQVARHISFNNVSDAPSENQRTVQMQVTDGDGGTSNTDIRGINVIAVNDVPELAITSTFQAYTENSVPVAIDSTLTLTDVDSSTLTGATIEITNFVSGQDVLSVTDSLGITGSWDAVNGILTLSGNTTVSNYQTVLRMITYHNTSENPNTTPRLIELAVTDDDNGSSMPVTRSISVNSVLDRPETNDVSASGVEDASSISITLTATDVDSTIQEYQLDSLPSNGTLYTDGGLNTVATVGTFYAATGEQLIFYFVPDNNWNGDTTFQFFAKDVGGLADSSSATATITVTSINDAPVFAQATYSFDYNENTLVNTVLGTVSASDADDSVSYSITAGDTNSYFEINSTGEISLTAAGVAAFTNDFETTANVHALTITATAGGETTTTAVTLNEQNVNDNAPVFAQATYSFDYNENRNATDILGAVSASDADDNVSYSITAGDTNSYFEINSTGEISLTAAGVAAFTNDFETAVNVHNLTITATAGGETTTTAVTLNEQNVNDNAPVFAQATYSFDYNENRNATDILGAVSASDADDNVSYSITAGDTNSYFEINSTGEISLTAAGVAAFTNDFETTANVHALTITATAGRSNHNHRRDPE